MKVIITIIINIIDNNITVKIHALRFMTDVSSAPLGHNGFFYFIVAGFLLQEWPFVDEQRPYG